MVRLRGSVEKGFLTPRFFRRKQDESLMMDQAISEDTFILALLEQRKNRLTHKEGRGC